mmetsp:Transcript_45141/g.118437  ORF Transcript_45141/g.118437 Transcript_45141/m.118437 type:complete len:270 (+) Transcript_45141:40-849(+)
MPGSSSDEIALVAGQRIFGCELIQKMGVLLRLPQVAISTACVSFHRFYVKRTMRKFDVRHYAMGALFLASKVEECPRRMRDVLAVFMHLEQKRKGINPPQPLDIYSQRYKVYKEQLVKAERELLKELGFILYTEHPHKLILNYVTLLTSDTATRKKLSQYAWSFINDSQRTDVSVRFAPETICCAALWLGARVHQIKLPSHTTPPWWELFEARKEDIDTVVAEVAALYSRGRAQYVEMPAAPAPAAAATGNGSAPIPVAPAASPAPPPS